MLNTIKQPKRIKARKAHTCDCCDKTIYVGEEHEIATYAFDGQIYDWRTCDRCKQYVDEAFANKDYSWDDGMSNQDFHDYMWNEHYDIASIWWKG